MPLTPIAWSDGRLRLLDQTWLPQEEAWLTLADYHQLAEAAGGVEAARQAVLEEAQCIQREDVEAKA